jgi:hypothetical protein
MKFKEKLLILFVAVFVSVLGFNLIASPFAELLMVAREAGNETFESHLAKGEVNSHQSPNHDDRALQFTPFNPDCSISK